jgi:hypothetical protein
MVRLATWSWLLSGAGSHVSLGVCLCCPLLVVAGYCELVGRLVEVRLGLS